RPPLGSSRRPRPSFALRARRRDVLVRGPSGVVAHRMADVDALDPAWFAATFEQVKNWGRWGPDDELGALNLITPERRAAATALVTDGRALSLAFDLETVPGPDNPSPVLHHMLNAGD